MVEYRVDARVGDNPVGHTTLAGMETGCNPSDNH